jgi:hypothetical protein
MVTTNPDLVAVPSVRSRVITRVCVPIAVFVLAWVNWRYPLVRFHSQLANQVAFLGVLLLPIAAGIAGTGVPERKIRWLLRLPVAPFATVGAVLALPALIGLIDTARFGYDPAFEPIARYALESRGLTVYRTNCGAPCSYGIVVRVERPLLPGLLVVRDVYREYPADTVQLRVLGGDQFEIGVPSRRGHPGFSANRDTVTLPRR